MPKIEVIAHNAAVAPLLWAIQANPHLWNLNTERVDRAAETHAGTDDIWVRYTGSGVMEDAPHESVWYESVAPLLPFVKPLVQNLMSYVAGERLGGVFITQIPPGGRVRPHHDVGWHATYYQKFAIQIQSAPGQLFIVEDEQIEPKPGDLFTFDGSLTHTVVNPTPFNRITLFASIKRG